MWYNDSYMPEYLFNNHEAYIGDTVGDCIKAFSVDFGFIAIGGLIVALLHYFYHPGLLPNYTYTKVSHEDYHNNCQRMRAEKIGLVKDFQGSSKL
jgi:hypothetical protein